MITTERTTVAEMKIDGTKTEMSPQTLFREIFSTHHLESVVFFFINF
jgi:hypothetical protein